METEQKIVKTINDLLDTIEKSIEIFSSPALIESIVILNAMGITNALNVNHNGAGFNGFAVNLSAPTIEYIPAGGTNPTNREIQISNP